MDCVFSLLTKFTTILYLYKSFAHFIALEIHFRKICMYMRLIKFNDI